MSRLEKIASQLKKEVSEILRRRIDDKRIGFVSITDVDVSVDFEHAKIYYSQIGSEKEKKATVKGLDSARHHIRSELFKVLRIKTVPRLNFEYDYSLEKGVLLVNKLNKLESDGHL